MSNTEVPGGAGEETGGYATSQFPSQTYGTSAPQETALQTREGTAAGVADPAALGLAGFAMTTMVLSVFNAGWINVAVEGVVLPLAFFYGGLVQLLAGMWEFKNRNTFGALAFSSYGAFWISFAFYVMVIGPTFRASPHMVGQATGLFLVAWAIFTAYMTVAALRTNAAILAVFVLLTITYVLLTIGAFMAISSLTKAGGWVGVATAIAAWYASFATVTNSTFKRTVLPVMPLAGLGTTRSAEGSARRL